MDESVYAADINKSAKIRQIADNTREFASRFNRRPNLLGVCPALALKQ
jgi:hypothetical protein